MEQIDLSKFPKVNFGKNVNITGINVQIADNAVIGDDVSIAAETISIGFDSVIEYGSTIKGLGKPMANIFIGDNCFIGFRNQILVPDFKMLDFSQLHNSGLHSGYKPLEIGYNCWIGQSTILNSTELLSIGNNVRIGTQSQLWTHVASGELLEGCTLYGNNPLILKDNVWIVGGAVISPGLVLEEGSIIMTGSVLTKSTISKHTYAGMPAKDVTDKLSFWKEMQVSDKAEMIKKFIEEFYEAYPKHKGRVMVTQNAKDIVENNCLVFSETDFAPEEMTNVTNSYFNLTNKKYTKRRIPIEIDWIKFTVGFRARFIPYGHK